MASWEEPDPADVRHLRDDTDWQALATQLGGSYPEPMHRCLTVARAAGASTMVIETRYVDLDYRSEYSEFYSKTFGPVPDTARRLHFFTSDISADRLWQLPEDAGYLGYVVQRPTGLGAVGRTLLAPPPGLASATRTIVADEVNFFGQPLQVRGFPFMQQETQLGRCAHAAAWMCHYAAHRRREVDRQPMAAFSLLAEPLLGQGRPIPSQGLTVYQLLELLRAFGLPPTFYNLDQLPEMPVVPWARPDPEPPEGERVAPGGTWNTRFIRLCCQYLNSGFPVLVGTEDHAFVLVGYRREPRDGRDWISFYRHDDQRGPYLKVDDVLDDRTHDGHSYGPWRYLIVPLPEKLWLHPWAAEHAGGTFLAEFARAVSAFDPEAEAVSQLIAEDRLALRTYAVPSNRFKEDAEGRLPDELTREYRLTRLPRYVWVVEAIDRELRRQGLPCVLGEVVLDVTSSDILPEVLVAHAPGVAMVHRIGGQPRFPIRCDPTPYPSGSPGHASDGQLGGP